MSIQSKERTSINKDSELEEHKERGERSIRLIRIRGVVESTGLSRSSIYGLGKEGLFPASVQLIAGGASVAWVESEVLDWIDDRIQARNDGVSING